MNKPRVKVCRAARRSGTYWLVKVDGQIRAELQGDSAQQTAHRLAAKARTALERSNPV